VGSPIIIETGGCWNKGSYHVQQKGSILNFAGSGGLSTSGGKVHFIQSAYVFGIPDEFFNGLDIAPGCSVKIVNGSSVSERVKIVANGNLQAVDGAVAFASNGRIEVAHHSSLNPGTASFTVFAVVMWDTTYPSEGWIIAKVKLTGASADQDGWYIRYSGTALEFVCLSNGTTYTTSKTFNPEINRPYFIMGVRDAGGNLYLYVDGVEEDNTAEPSGEYLDNTEKLYIGNIDKGSGFTYPHKGKVLDARMWTGTALDADDMLDLMGRHLNISTYQQLWLKLDECTGDPEDSSGVGNDGSLLGASSWEDPERFVVESDLIIGPDSSTTLPDGIAQSIWYHGTITVPSPYTFEYRHRCVGLGSISGTVQSVHYHSSSQTLTISSLSDLADNELIKIDLSLRANHSAKCDITAIDTPAIREYLVGSDLLDLSWNSQTLFKGKLWRRAPKSGNTVLLTYYDYLFDLKKMKIFSWIFGNLHQWKIATVTKASTPSISISSFYSTDYHAPVVDITFLHTKNRNLTIDTNFKSTIGFDGTNHEYAAQYYDLGENPGEFYRLAVCLGNLSKAPVGRKFYYKIYDMDPDSSNYDTAIISGTITDSEVPTGPTTYTWIVKDLIALHGRVKAPRKIKIAVGGIDNELSGTSLECDWFGAETELFGENNGKEGTGTPTESNLDYITDTYDPSGINETCGVRLGSEVELSSDWSDKRDMSDFKFLSSTIQLLSHANRPTFANRTRQVTSSTWNIARVTMWYDQPTIDDYIENIWNSWGRYWFNKCDVSVDGTSKLPFLILKDTDPLSFMVSLCELYQGEISNTFSGSDVVFSAQSARVESDWSSIGADEKLKRTIILSEDLDKYPVLKRYLLDRYMGGDFEVNKEEISRQITINMKDGQKPVVSLHTTEPYYPTIEEIPGDMEQSVEQAEHILNELGYDIHTGQAETLDIPMDSDNVLFSPGELVKIVDGRHGFGRIMRAVELRRQLTSDWRLKLTLEDPIILNPVRRAAKNSVKFIAGYYTKYGGYYVENPVPVGGGEVTPSERFDPDKVFETVLQVESEYTNTSTDQWWIHLGSDPTDPYSDTMKTTDQNEQIIVPAERIVLDSGDVILYARITEEHLLGEFVDTFKIREIGAIHSTSKPTNFNSNMNVRIVLDVPSVTATTLWPAFLGTDEVYRPYPYFLRNGIIHLTFHHKLP